MFKKIMLSIVAATILLAAETLVAQDMPDEPIRRPKRRQAERLRAGPRADWTPEGEQPKALQQDSDSPEQSMWQRQRGTRPWNYGPIKAGFNRWFAALEKAYRENDKQQMGQLIKKMHQARQQSRRERAGPYQRGQEGRGWSDTEGIPPETHRGWGRLGRRGPGQFRGRPRGWREDFSPRGPGRPGPAGPPRGLREPEPPGPPEDVELPRRGRRMGRWDQDWQPPRRLRQETY